MTYKELLKEASDILEKNEVADYKNDARLLCEYVFEKDRSYLIVHQDEEADEELCKRFNELLDLRAEHVPLQHIIGQVCFMNYNFFVNGDVLIPRQDTEVLVEKTYELIVEQLKKSDKKSVKILDMCTGSGCIAISLYKMLKEHKNDLTIEVTASDISEKALETAKKNAKANDAVINFVKSNLFGEFENSFDFDFIVSNPPYIEREEIEKLMPEVRDYEPRKALDGGKDGLDFYRIITKDAKKNTNSFYLIYEIGYNQGEDLKRIFLENGYDDIDIIKDLAGLDRVALARRIV